MAAKPGLTGGIRGVQARLKVTQVRSTISHIARNRATVRALGLHGIGSTSVVADNPATRGMVRQVHFLVSVEEVAATESAEVVAQARSGPGGNEHANERTRNVRERASGGTNEGMSRISGDQEKA